MMRSKYLYADSNEIELIVEKHLPGGHDQKDHGSWATGGGEGYLSKSTEKEIAESRALFQELMGPDANISDILEYRNWATEQDYDRLYEKVWKRYQQAGMGKNTAMLQATIDLGRVTWADRLEQEKATWEERKEAYKKAVADPTDEWHESSKNDLAALESGMKTAEERVTNALKNGEVTMAATEDVFQSILDDGKYKNQFETRTSNGTLDTGIRKMGEGLALSVPAGTKLADRPVYGYIADNKNPTTSYKEIDAQLKADYDSGLSYPERMANLQTNTWDSILSVNNYEAEQYGEIRFTLKPEVRSRTTVTIGDSLRAGMLADNLTNPEPNLFHMGIYKQGAPDHTGGKPIARYLEAQIHGGVKVSDISHIYAPADKVNAVEAMLEARGINIPVSPRAGS